MRHVRPRMLSRTAHKQIAGTNTTRYIRPHPTTPRPSTAPRAARIASLARPRSSRAAPRASTPRRTIPGALPQYAGRGGRSSSRALRRRNSRRRKSPAAQQGGHSHGPHHHHQQQLHAHPQRHAQDQYGQIPGRKHRAMRMARQNVAAVDVGIPQRQFAVASRAVRGNSLRKATWSQSAAPDSPARRSRERSISGRQPRSP